MPQLIPGDFLPQLIWLAITFIILYVVMAKVALPRVGGVLETRAAKIAGDLDQASRLKAQAEAAGTAYQKALTDARAQATEINRQTAARLAALAAERQAQLGSELATRIRAAEGQIIQAKATAMANVVQVAAEAAISATERLVALQVSSADATNTAQAIMRERG